jgi:ubiquinol-cytochrome c reductase cytochrome c subunit
VLVFLGLLVTGLIYAGLTPGQASAAGSTSDDVLAGRSLFRANCTTCHGLNAEGRSNAPSLVGVGAAAVDFQVGTGRMPLAGTGPQAPKVNDVKYTDTQIKQLAAYVASLGPGPSIPTAAQTDPSQGDPANGAATFRVNCAMCHNFAGKGGALTLGKYAPTLDGVSPQHIAEAMLTGPQSMPVFNDSTVSAKDKQDVIAYLTTIQKMPTPGGLSLGSIGPVGEGLVGWLIGLGVLVGCAVWLGAKSA